MGKTSLRLRRHARENRSDPTPGERVLWQALRRRSAGVRFRRQHPIDPYICDFVSPEARIVIEVDGSRHVSRLRQGLDRDRDDDLKSRGYRVLRVTEHEARYVAIDIGPRVRASPGTGGP